MLIGDIMRRTARRFPDSIGVVFEDRQFTWSEFNARVNRVAHALIGAGLRKGDRAAIWARNSHRYLEIYGALAKTGVIGVPVNVSLKTREIASILDNAGPTALIVEDALEDRIKDVDLGGIRLIGMGGRSTLPSRLEALCESESEDEPAVALDPSDLFVIGYTSGTTGAPKGATIAHRNTVAGVISHVMSMSLRPSSVFLMHQPMFFFASGINRFNAVMAGSKIVISTSDTLEMLTAIGRHRVTHFTISPTSLQRLLSHERVDEFDLDSIEMVGGTGAKFSVELIGRLIKKLGNVWQTSYGTSETGPATWLLREEYASPDDERLGSVGRTAAMTEVGLFGDDGAMLPFGAGRTGEIAVRGEPVSAGYWRDEKATAAALRDGWFLTGDLGYQDERGYLFLVGRKKEMIISGGVNIYPTEIEELLSTHPAVLECAVVGRPDPDWGEAPVAVVVKRVGAEVSGDELIQFSKTHLASYKKPRDVVFVDALPYTSSGKVNKPGLREALDRLQEASTGATRR